MPFRYRLLVILALIAAVAPVASGQDSGPLAAMMARGSNPNGPFAKRLSASDSLVARARDQIGEGAAVTTDTSALRPGDLLMFGRGRSSAISHVGIYVGDGRMVHASTSQHRVIETALPATGSALRLKTVRRVLRDSTVARHGSE